VLAKQYDDLKWDLWKLYGPSPLVSSVCARDRTDLCAALTGSISRLAVAAGKIGGGNLDFNVKEPKRMMK